MNDDSTGPARCGMGDGVMWNVMSDLVRDAQHARSCGCKPGDVNPDGDPHVVAQFACEQSAQESAEKERRDGATLAYVEWEG